LHGAVDIDKSLVIFGGVTNNLMLLNDVWRYQPESNNWEVLGEGTDAMDRPTTREGMSMVTSDKGLNVSDCCLVWQYTQIDKGRARSVLTRFFFVHFSNDHLCFFSPRL